MANINSTPLVSELMKLSNAPADAPLQRLQFSRRDDNAGLVLVGTLRVTHTVDELCSIRWQHLIQAVQSNSEFCLTQLFGC